MFMPAISFGGFDWDAGNIKKCQSHGISLKAIEAFFRQENILVAPDVKHSEKESRFLAIGESASGRLMFVVFTMRKRREEMLIRPISTRYMHEKEIEKYRKKNT